MTLGVHLQERALEAQLLAPPGEFLGERRSTLAEELPRWREQLGFQRPFLKMDTQGHDVAVFEGAGDARSEERRVGKEGRDRGGPGQLKKKKRKEGGGGR